MEPEYDTKANPRVDIADGIVMEARSGDFTLFPHFNAAYKDADGSERDLHGQTGFFRFRRTMERVIRHFMNQPRDLPLRFLFAPCSIGCEPYSFAAMALKAGLFDRHPRLQLDALDISPDFISYARAGRYPLSLLRRMPIDDILSLMPESASLQRIFGQAGDDTRNVAAIDESVRARVRFFDAQPFENFSAAAPYDFVMACNVLMHIPPTETPFFVGRLADMSGGLMATTYWASEFGIVYEVGGVRRALAQHGFVEVDPRNLAPVIPKKMPQALSRTYRHVCRLRHGVESVLLYSSGQKPAYRDGFVTHLGEWGRQQAYRIFG